MKNKYVFRSKILLTSELIVEDTTSMSVSKNIDTCTICCYISTIKTRCAFAIGNIIIACIATGEVMVPCSAITTHFNYEVNSTGYP